MSEIEETKRVVKRGLEISLLLEKSGYGGIYTERISIGKTIVKLAADATFFGVFWKINEGAILDYSDWMNYYGDVASDINPSSIDDIADYMLYMMKEKGFDMMEEPVRVTDDEELPF